MSEPKVTPESLQLERIRERVPPCASGTQSISVSWDDVIWLIARVDAAAERIEGLVREKSELVSDLVNADRRFAAERAKLAMMEAEREVVAEARAEVVTVEEQLAAERAKVGRLREAIEQACRMLPGETDVYAWLDRAARSIK
jgi:hypothetical protein